MANTFTWEMVSCKAYDNIIVEDSTVNGAVLDVVLRLTVSNDADSFTMGHIPVRLDNPKELATFSDISSVTQDNVKQWAIDKLGEKGVANYQRVASNQLDKVASPAYNPFA